MLLTTFFLGLRRRQLLATMMLTIIAISCVNSTGTEPTTTPVDADSGTVLSIVDGDTIDVEIDGVKERVRLIGIDTPESVAPDRPKQCFGDQASAALEGLIAPGTHVTLSRDVEARDRFGRLLLYIHRSEDNLFVNEWMVAEGFAASVSYEPNVAMQQTLNAAQLTAEQQQRGLWASCDGPDQPIE